MAVCIVQLSQLSPENFLCLLIQKVGHLNCNLLGVQHCLYHLTLVMFLIYEKGHNASVPPLLSRADRRNQMSIHSYVAM